MALAWLSASIVYKFEETVGTAVRVITGDPVVIGITNTAAKRLAVFAMPAFDVLATSAKDKGPITEAAELLVKLTLVVENLHSSILTFALDTNALNMAKQIDQQVADQQHLHLDSLRIRRTTAR